MPRKLNELEKNHFVVPLALDGDQLIRFYIRPGRHFSLSSGLSHIYVKPEASVIDEPEEKTAQIVLRYLNTSERMKKLTHGLAIYSYKGPFQQLHLSIFTWQGNLIFEQYLIKGGNNMMLTVEMFEENGQLYVYIADENSTGCRYPIKDKFEVGAKVQQYIKDNI